jgi:hypothetical protein
LSVVSMLLGSWLGMHVRVAAICHMHRLFRNTPHAQEAGESSVMYQPVMAAAWCFMGKAASPGFLYASVNLWRIPQ